MKNRHQIQTLYAYDLFSNKQFPESMKQFLELNTGNCPETIKQFIILIHYYISGIILTVFPLADPYDVIRLFPNLLPQNGPPVSDDPVQSEGPPKFQNRDQEKSIVALIEYLTEVRMIDLQNLEDFSNVIK